MNVSQEIRVLFQFQSIDKCHQLRLHVDLYSNAIFRHLILDIAFYFKLKKSDHIKMTMKWNKWPAMFRFFRWTANGWAVDQSGRTGRPENLRHPIRPAKESLRATEEESRPASDRPRPAAAVEAAAASSSLSITTRCLDR